MRSIVYASLLAALLSVPALAGHVNGPPKADPTPTPESVSGTSSTASSTAYYTLLIEVILTFIKK